MPLPGRVSLVQFERELFAFLNARRYVELGWLRDKRVRDTGPYLAGKSYGTHPAVRVYYSPGVIRWLKGGRAGAIPDGEMIIKEQYAAPAVRHEDKTEEQLWESLESWTVMVKDASGSHDGWFWSNPVKGQCVVDNHKPPFDHPVSGFGHYCIRCHAATQSPGAEPASAANEFTFASLRNIAGFPGEPILFRVDDSWRRDARKERDASPGDEPRQDAHPRCARPEAQVRPSRGTDPRFLGVFDSIKPVELSSVLHLPPETHDWAVARRDRSREFVTSNQCMSCHAALMAPFGPSMFVPAGESVEYGAPGRDVSPYGEWRWTPMGLAGRDPIFHAQVESEIQLLRRDFGSDPKLADEACATLAETCLKCHAAMGKTQFDIDQSGSSAKLSLDHVQAVAGPDGHPGDGDSMYGALARDGVSCMVCHRMQPRVQPPDDHRPYLQYFLETSITGNFHLGAPGEIYGPFADDAIAPYAMEHATGLKPKQGNFLKSSQLCGTCHTVVLPTVDRPRDASDSDHPDELLRSEAVPFFRQFHHHVEQATYLEWLNSEYENEINEANPSARSCQDCHMARGLKDDRHGLDIAQIQTRIAAIQDTTYPDAENLAPHDRLKVRIRDEGYRRHNFSGLNVFLLAVVRPVRRRAGRPQGRLHDGLEGGHRARRRRHGPDGPRRRRHASTFRPTGRDPNRVTARVVVRNKVGHRFPSGVGFRRAFLELAVVQSAEAGSGPERVVWASGRTNEVGMILGADGRPLPTESFARDETSGRQRYQGHHEFITSPDQVQVYETLLHDAKGAFTTSFVRGCEVVKDNRLLPKGWRREGPGPALTGRFLQATYPDPDAAADPRYADGSGSDEVIYRMELPAGDRPSPAPGPRDLVLPGRPAVLPAQPLRDRPRRPGDPPTPRHVQSPGSEGDADRGLEAEDFLRRLRRRARTLRKGCESQWPSKPA